MLGNIAKEFSRRNWEYLALAFIVIFAVALRLFHFHDWLYFAMDQARDAMLVHKAYDQGVSQLPLLGPRAAGTYLRLGPIFYFFQYISAKLFNSVDPAVLAYPDLFFGILSVPLFYFFLRLYFKKITSLLSTAMFALSFLAIEYSRFAWNPNSIPFWTLVCFYGLVRFSQGEENQKGKCIWLGISAAGWAVASQLHFLVFVSLPVIILIYLFWLKGFKKIDIKGLVLILFIALIFYFPMILSDIKTGGDNFRQFVFALRNKPNAEYSLEEKFFQNFVNHGKYYLMLFTSYMSKASLNSMLVGLIFIMATLFRMFFQMKNEKDENRKSFIKLIFIWFGVYFVLLVPFAFQIRTRFFLPVLFLPFVMAAFWIEWLLQVRRRRIFSVLATTALVFSVIFLNCEGVYAWYKGLAFEKEVKPIRNRYLDQRPYHEINLKVLKSAADYLDQRSKEEKRKIILYGEITFRAPVQYLLEIKEPSTNYKLLSRKDEDRSALYFGMTAGSGGFSEIPEKYREKFNLQKTYYFGTRLQFFEMELKDAQPDYKDKKEFNSKEKNKSQSKPRRKERVFWGELF